MIKRSSGVLMHISSLPGNFGTGTIGEEARAFARQLAEMGCAYWQILPINHITDENSPYTNQSLFALNPNFIDLRALEAEGLLTQDEVSDVAAPVTMLAQDAGLLAKKKLVLLRKAFSRAGAEKLQEVRAFAEKNASWIDSYALFTVLKNVYGDICWNIWPGIGLRLHKDDAVARAFAEHENDVLFWKYVQYVAYAQWAAFKQYVNGLGIGVIGDIPIYASFDSSDVWAYNHLFQLNTKHIPKLVSGVPPDYFNKSGQLWRNPLYDWDEMKKDSYAWWMARLQNALEIYDVVRIDHFRGIYSYWAVPYANKTAKKGEWVKGPGMDLVRKMKSRFSDSAFIIEDLGDVDSAVKRFYGATGYPGMKVMQFGFGKGGDEAHKLKNFGEHCVAYTGTHDNNTILGWYGEASEEKRASSFKELGVEGLGATAGGEAICKAWIERLLQSPAELAIVPIQDLLYQGAESRMNYPGTISKDNWSYRVSAEQLSSIDAAWVLELNRRTNRLNKFAPQAAGGSPAEAGDAEARKAAQLDAAPVKAAAAGKPSSVRQHAGRLPKKRPGKTE